MRNISVDDDTYKRARMVAAALDTSISALVKGYLQQLGAMEIETERLKRQERKIRSQIAHFTASSRLSREDSHSRAALMPPFLDTNVLLYSISRNPT